MKRFTISVAKLGKNIFIYLIVTNFVLCEYAVCDPIIPNKPSQITSVKADLKGDTNIKFIHVKTQILPNGSSILFEVTFSKKNTSQIGISTFLSSFKDEKIEACLKEFEQGESITVGIVIPKKYLASGMIETDIDGVTYRIHPISNF